MNNGTHEITSTCTTIVRDMSQSPRNPAPKQGKGKAAVVADAADAAGGAKQEAAVTVAAPAGGAGADPAAAQRAVGVHTFFVMHLVIASNSPTNEARDVVRIFAHTHTRHIPNRTRRGTRARRR